MLGGLQAVPKCRLKAGFEVLFVGRRWQCHSVQVTHLLGGGAIGGVLTAGMRRMLTVADRAEISTGLKAGWSAMGDYEEHRRGDLGHHA